MLSRSSRLFHRSPLHASQLRPSGPWMPRCVSFLLPGVPVLLAVACGTGAPAVDTSIESAAPDAGENRIPADLNGDGYADLVFANTMNGDDYHVDSIVYWGSDQGYDEYSVTTLPTVGAMGVEIADLDADGWADIVFNQVSDGETRFVDSVIYWGGSGGFEPSRITALPTVGCADVTVSDVDLDGYLDLVFANRFDGSSYEVDAYIYWGSAGGYSVDNRLELPVFGASRSRVADLDRDGFRDIVFSNAAFPAESSYVYWGGSDGLDPQHRTELPSEQPEGLEVADLDGDGWLDILLGEWMGTSGFETDSIIYWGSPDGFDDHNKTTLPTLGATDVTVQDLDADGQPDILFVNSFDADAEVSVDSYIYWGSQQGYSQDRRSGLPSVGASEAQAADLDGDGFLDIVIANFYQLSGDDSQLRSYLYWGSASGFSESARTELPTAGAGAVEALQVLP